MCGICGFTKTNTDSDQILKNMCDVMAHRGPDGEGRYLDDDIALGHRRLSLIDLEGGSQPMVRSTGDKTARVTSPARTLDGAFCQDKQSAAARGDYAIVFNGEIYNYQDLRAELEHDGWAFATHSDTEVLLVAYLAWGEAALPRLRGMFAFAIWDKKTHELFCARDFFGIKPFYYTEQHGSFIFASEIKCILEHPAYTRELNEEALEQYLCFQFSALDETFFKGIFKLPQGHCLTVRADGTCDIKRWWRPSFAKPSRLSMKPCVNRCAITMSRMLKLDRFFLLASIQAIWLPAWLPKIRRFIRSPWAFLNMKGNVTKYLGHVNSRKNWAYQTKVSI